MIEMQLGIMIMMKMIIKNKNNYHPEMLIGVATWLSEICLTPLIALF